MSYARTLVASPLFALLSAAVPSVTPLSAEGLQQSCRGYASAPHSREALICTSYIQGYLDAARSGAELATDPSSRSDVSETWEERAARTRLGKHSLEGLRRKQHRLCVAPTVSLSDIVAQLLAYLRTRPPRADTTAADALSQALLLHHPCEE